MASIKKRVWKRAHETHVLSDIALPVGVDYDRADSAWSCHRKKAYPDEKFARRVARLMREERGAAVVAYACRHCGLYHVGRAPG